MPYFMRHDAAYHQTYIGRRVTGHALFTAEIAGAPGGNPAHIGTIAGKQMSEIKKWCEKDVSTFLSQSKKYLLY